MNKGEENITSLDLLKIMLSIMVIVIHVNPRGSDLNFIVYPFVRIAVPLFYIISSFFVFRKLNEAQKKDQFRIIRKFVSRNAKLYMAWFILLLPSVVVIRGYYKLEVINLLKRFLIDLIFGSTFKGSWFLTSLMIAVPAVYVLINALGWGGTGVLCVIIYSLCCLASSYYGLLPADSLIVKIIGLYPGNLYNGFPVALIWVYIGAIESIFISKAKFSKSVFWMAAFISLLLLEIEFFVTVKWAISSDCYIMLIPFACILFEIFYRKKITLNNARKLRSYSTIFYCLHPTVVSFLFLLFEYKGFRKTSYIVSIIVFVITVVTCVLISSWIIELSKKPKMKILKNLY